MKEPVLILKPGRDKSLAQRHPWVYSGAVDRLTTPAEAGQTVLVRNASGDFMCRAAYSPQSKIVARAWSWDETETIDAEFFARRVAAAGAYRRAVLQEGERGAYRLAHGESDGLPGVIVDVYGEWAVAQLLSAGAERWREEIAAAVRATTNCRGVYERSDVEVRALEGLPEQTGLLWGEAPPDQATIEEYGLRFLVDMKAGQKTGFYLDQRRNRRRVGEFCAGKRVLNCFCFTGGFSLHALRGGAAEVLSVDSSAEALRLAQLNLERNDLPAERAAWLEEDVFQALRKLRDRAEQFDVIVLDPPKFAPTAAQAEKAARGYKDINLLALKLLRPGGMLFTYSCSGGVSADLFQKIVAGAAADARRPARIVEHAEQAPDHPVSLLFPEGAYLKGLAVAVE